MLLSRLTLVLALIGCVEKSVTETDEEIIDVDGDGVEASLDCDDSNLTYDDGETFVAL